MSEQNVEVIRRAIEAWNRDGVDAVVDVPHPDAVLYAVPEWPEDPVYRGREGWRKLMTLFTETFDDIRWEINRLIDAGDRVVALVQHHSKIKGTGVPLVQPLGVIAADFKPDGVAEIRFFLTWAEALEAAGLRE